MAMFYCQECDRLLDGDWVESEELDGEMVCLDCHLELTPEDWEDYEIRFDSSNPKGFQWTATHKDYDGAPIHSFGGPADPRHFLGESEKDVWQQVIEFNETEHDPMDDGDWAYEFIEIIKL